MAAKKKPSLSKQRDAQVRAFEQFFKQLDQAAKPNSKRRGKPMVWDGTSECFDDLRYSPQAGGVFATFTDGTSYFYALSRSEARDWFADDVGRYFNAAIR